MSSNVLNNRYVINQILFLTKDLAVSPVLYIYIYIYIYIYRVCHGKRMFFKWMLRSW